MYIPDIRLVRVLHVVTHFGTHKDDPMIAPYSLYSSWQIGASGGTHLSISAVIGCPRSASHCIWYIIRFGEVMLHNFDIYFLTFKMLDFHASLLKWCSPSWNAECNLGDYGTSNQSDTMEMELLYLASIWVLPEAPRKRRMYALHGTLTQFLLLSSVSSIIP